MFEFVVENSHPILGIVQEAREQKQSHLKYRSLILIARIDSCLQLVIHIEFLPPARSSLKRV
jgi:hypothetical protein